MSLRTSGTSGKSKEKFKDTKSHSTKFDPEKRIQLISIGILLFSLCLIVKLYLVQIVHSQDFRDQANRQYVQSSSKSFNRGTIFFTDKDGNKISAATLQSGYLMSINPKQVTDPADECSKLSSFITLDCGVFATKAAKKTATYIEIAKKVTSDQGKAIAPLKLPGVNLYADKWHYYPGSSLAAHTLGFVAYKGNDLLGRYGLERYYESTLKRTDDDVFVNFFAEIFADIKSTVTADTSNEGDIVTTIEPTTQSYLESVLQKTNDKYRSESTGGIIINPMTGEIYAMALTPTFDPNNFQTAANNNVFSNDLIENVHEMGSIIKPLTMAAGIDVGVINANTTYNDTASVTLNNKTIYNFDKQGRGLITLQEALGKSLNVGFVYAEQKMGNATFSKYMKAFGLGVKSGIDLPNEGSGLISNLDSPRDIEHATASFGQGIAMTPIATVRALSSLINGGNLITPHLVKRIDYKLGYSKTPEYPVGPRVIKPETSKAIVDMLVTDFDKYFQNGKSSDPHYSIGEKTGTAQISLPGGGGYYEDRYLHSFVGFLPASAPKFLVFMYTIYPKNVQYSSETLGPAFVDLEKFLINYYQLPPDR